MKSILSSSFDDKGTYTREVEEKKRKIFLCGDGNNRQKKAPKAHKTQKPFYPFFYFNFVSFYLSTFPPRIE